MSTVLLLHNDVSEAAEVDNSLDMCMLISNLDSSDRQDIHSPDELNPFAAFLASPHSTSFCTDDFNPFSSLLNSPLYRESISSLNSSNYSLSNFDIEFDMEFLSDEEFDDAFVFDQDTLPFTNRKKLSRTRSFFSRFFNSFVTKRRRKLSKNIHKKLSKGISCPLENATFVNKYLCD